MLVSTVIPTCRRPRLLLRAVDSVLKQSFSDLEVIIVRAAKDPETDQVLASMRDSRIRVLPFEGPVGPSAARNRAVRESAGEWVAFLDDDDSWLPEKLRLQMEAASASASRRPILSCGMLARDGRSERLWPRRLPMPGEPIGDYLFRRKTLWGGCGFLQTSTLLARREHLLETPFREDLRALEDLDWVLRASRAPGASVEFVSNNGRPTPLAVWNIDPGRSHESSVQGWRYSLAWISESSNLVSPEAYAGYLLTWVSREAARDGACRIHGASSRRRYRLGLWRSGESARR